MVRFGGDMRTLAELEDRLEHRRRIAPRAGHDKAVVLGRSERLRLQLAEDVRGQIGDILALECSSGGDRSRVAGCVAVALLGPGGRHDDVIDGLRERAFCGARDQPRLARESAHGFEGQRSSAFV